ncbi:Cation transporter family protein [Ancylostoma ceylanicum]|uniref:Cation transporter family protein n=1 Tax=Ancylostoma ceylanicum TaxID=53326 RepID=A0A0D6LF80_9BILA|nr:Cation transporter family protein [Ancylostoma ceylanicum]
MFFLILTIIATAVSQVNASQAEAELYRTLMKNYSAVVRPVRNPNKVLTVSMKVFLQQILNVDEQDQVIEVNAWLKYIWNDYRLRWRPLAFDNISSVRFPGDEQQIWQPDILLYNRHAILRLTQKLAQIYREGNLKSANERFDSSYKSNLVVYSNGLVNWIPPGIFRITCKMDITMFPFDEQICFLKFGSWTYHGFALDLQIEQDEGDPSMDTSTYISNGEWQLVSAPAQREVTYYQCCPEPYPSIKNPSEAQAKSAGLLKMQAMREALQEFVQQVPVEKPSNDAPSEAVPETTILLSVCFFLTILSEMTPTTSESIPLLGIFFSSVTLIVTMSTTFTVCVLNIRYRQHSNHKMSSLMRYIFVEFIPWLLLMKRPGYRFRAAKAVNEHVLDESHCVQAGGLVARCAARDADFSSSCNELNVENPDVLCSALPGEKLELSRKVGEGLFVPRKCESSRKRRMERCERYVSKCKEVSMEGTPESQHSMLTLDLYVQISRRLRGLRSYLDERVVKRESMEEWKFAAIALDRLCLYMFGILLTVCTTAIFVIQPVTKVKALP